jgi:hypothetical protein
LNVRIAVLGPPGVEKSKFARALGKEFNLKVVDNYVQRLQKATGLALGPWSSHSENFMVAGVRLAEEYKAGEERITVGTVVDSIAYSATHSDVVLHNTQAGHQAAYAAAQGAISGLSLLYTETWDYHLAFLLSFSEKEREKRGRVWETALDMAYLPVIESYGVPFVCPLGGTTADRIKIATEIIHLAQEDQATDTATPETPSPDE